MTAKARNSPSNSAHRQLSFAARCPGVDAVLLLPTRRHAIALFALTLLSCTPGPIKAASTDGQLTWGVHISLAPTWFDPAEMSGIITPYIVYYALHDALVKAMPGNRSPRALPSRGPLPTMASSTSSSCATA